MRKGLTRLGLSLGVAVVLTACSVARVTEMNPLPREARWAMLPIVNQSSTPQAGQRAEAIAATLLRAEGVTLVEYPPAEDADSFPVLEEGKRLVEARQWARRGGYRYGVTGTVSEWRYKSGLDGEPAVGVTLKIIDLQNDTVLWSATGARSGWGRESLAGTGHKVIAGLIEGIELR
ncbi:hypothetical protein H0Z60_04825 [Ectothiorhodospiraceae bacterium WFHF3C12]|nr:hypothetical protein [Ectothiorhodospiraceae bacterium WFHF3C12]